MIANVKDKLISRLVNHKHTLEEIATLYKLPVEDIQNLIKQIRAENIPIQVKTSVADGNKDLYHIKTTPDVGNVFYISGADNKNRVMNFASISDLHFSSNYHLPNTFNETLKKIEGLGITRVYISGDIVDGRDIYKGHNENIITSSVEGQTDLAAESFAKFPKLEFWGIAGNHDYSFTQKTGTKPLAILEAKVDNFKNLGDLRADIVYHGIRIRLLHGAGGRAYARSYPSQTYLRDVFSGTEKEDMQNMPHIILLGHYHTFYHGKDHGIHIIQPTSFQDGDNEYCIRRGLTGPNGGFVINLKYQTGKINEFNTKFIQPKCLNEEKGLMHSKTTRSYN